MWGGFGADGVTPPPPQAGLQQGEMFVVSLTQKPTLCRAVGQWGALWEVRDGPQGPSQWQGSGRALSPAWDAGWFLLEQSPHGLGSLWQFG